MRVPFCHRQVGEIVEDVASWNPVRDGQDRLIHYIDLSSVDQDTKIIQPNEPIIAREAPSRARQLVQTDDVLVSTVRPNLNGVAKVPEALDGATASTGFCALRPKHNELDSGYLFHWVKTPAFIGNMVRKATGASYPAVSDRIVLESQIPLPPLAEQQRIAAILDQAEALRAKRRHALAQLGTLTRSLFLDLFGDPATNPKGWPLVAFPSVVYFQEGPGIRNWQFRNQGIKLINVKNIVEGVLVPANTDRYLEPSEVKRRYSHFLLNAGDFVLASSGVTWGKIAEVAASHLPLCLNTSMIRVHPIDDGIQKAFLRCFIESMAFRKQILRLITGSAQPNFGPAHLKQVLLPRPKVEVQREFTAQVSAVERLKAVQRMSLAKLDALFASLQHRAFRGEL